MQKTLSGVNITKPVLLKLDIHASAEKTEEKKVISKNLSTNELRKLPGTNRFIHGKPASDASELLAQFLKQNTIDQTEAGKRKSQPFADLPVSHLPQKSVPSTTISTQDYLAFGRTQH
jgi:hypothetical protein